MTDSINATIKFTLNDVEVASRLYEALVQHAKATGGAPIVYGDLLTLARQMHPEDAVLARGADRHRNEAAVRRGLLQGQRLPQLGLPGSE